MALARDRAEGCSPTAGRTLAGAAKKSRARGYSQEKGVTPKLARSRKSSATGRPDDVEVVSVDTLHQRRADALDGVGARAVAPLPGTDVGGELRRR